MTDQVIMAIVIACGVVFGLLALIGVPVSLGLRHASKQRELEHLERMKALELGRPLPGEEPATIGPDSNKGTGIAIWVPLGSLGIAMAATAAPHYTHDHDVVVWCAAGAVGVAGVVCGTVLAFRNPTIPVSLPSSPRSTKAPIDADELDVVSRRG